MREAICRIENQSTSDCGIIARLDLEPSPGKAHVLQYRYATFFSAGGLKLHNQLVYSQTAHAAALVGAEIIATDVPDAYQEL